MNREFKVPPANNLADIRIRLGLTQLELAIRSQMPQSAISRIERQDDVVLSTLARYAAGLGGHLEIRIRIDGDLVGVLMPSHAKPRNLGIAARRRRAQRVTSRDPLEPSAPSVWPPPAGTLPTE